MQNPCLFCDRHPVTPSSVSRSRSSHTGDSLLPVECECPAHAGLRQPHPPQRHHQQHLHRLVCAHCRGAAAPSHQHHHYHLPQGSHQHRPLSVGSAEESSTRSLMDSSLSTFQAPPIVPPVPPPPVRRLSSCNQHSHQPRPIIERAPSSCCSSSLLSLSPSPSCATLEQFTHLGHAGQLLSKMSEELRGGRLADIYLLAGDKRLPAHRVVLSAASDYFAAMFGNDLREAVQTEVTIRDVEPNALETLIEYIYTGHLNLDEECVENLLSAACLLQMTEVVRACEHFLVRLLHASNCLGIRQFGEVRGCRLLYDRATSYTLEHFPMVVHQHEFLELMSADELLVLVQSQDLNVPDEGVVLTAALRWCKHDLTARRQHFPRLLAAVKLPLLPAALLSDIVESEPLVSESVECLRLVVDAMRFHLLPDRYTDTSANRCRPRSSTVGRLWAIGGMTTSRAIQEIQEYNPRTNQWWRVGKLPLQRLQFGCAVVDGKLLIVGGRDGLKTLNTVECYDPANKTWQVLASMATHRHGLGVTVLHGVLYAVGGHDGWSYLNSVERWDPKQKVWSFVSPMAMPRSTVGVAALRGKLYAVGGRDGASCLRAAECFDPHTQKWSLCAPMHARRGGVGVAAVSGFLYAVGGHDAPANNPGAIRFPSVERYDPATDEWTAVAPLSSPRESVALCPLGDRLFAVGGFDGQAYTEAVQAYDPAADAWVKVTSLPTGRAGVVAVGIPNSVCYPQLSVASD